MDHEQRVRKILSGRTDIGTLKSRESNTVEFKQSYNKASSVRYAKSMAAFANNSGGYIIFGIKDTPREVIGLKKDSFENLQQEDLTETLNLYFTPAIEWEMGVIVLNEEQKTDDGEIIKEPKKIGWIYAQEAETKPVIAQRDNNSEKISTGDMFYRYRAKNSKIKPAELNQIILERVNRERENLLRLIEVIRENGTATLGIVNYSNGKLSTPYGVDIVIERKIVVQALKRAKFIKEGSFSETKGTPVIKVTGNIDLAEEVPVPEGDPNITHPFIQSEMAEKLDISLYDIQALIWYFKMKESKKFHLEIVLSKKPRHKFSNYALEFLQAKINELRNNPEEFTKIKTAYQNRVKHGGEIDGKNENGVR